MSAGDEWLSEYPYDDREARAAAALDQAARQAARFDNGGGFSAAMAALDEAARETARQFAQHQEDIARRWLARQVVVRVGRSAHAALHVAPWDDPLTGLHPCQDAVHWPDAQVVTFGNEEDEP